jgi:hypothetical protein
MHGVHIVQFGLKFKAQLDLLFMVLSVLHILFLKFKSHLAFRILFLLEVIRVFLQYLEVATKPPFVLCLLIELLLEFFF